MQGQLVPWFVKKTPSGGRSIVSVGRPARVLIPGANDGPFGSYVDYDPVPFFPNGTTEAAIKAAGESVLQAMINDGVTIPSRVSLVGWRWSTQVDPYTLQQQLTANQVPVVPEDENAFMIAVREISSTRVGTYLEGARLPCGVLGLGINARIGMHSSFPATPRVGGSEGANQAMLKFWMPNSIVANITFVGSDVGGLQFDAFKIINCEGTVVWRVKTKGHIGYNNMQPDETFGFTVQSADGTARTHIRRIHVDGSDHNNLKTGSGGVHYVSTRNHLTELFVIERVRGHGMAHYAVIGDTLTRDGYIIEPGGGPYRVEPAFTGNTKLGKVNGSGLNYEASGLGRKRVERVHIIMHNSVTGNTREAVSVLRPDAAGGNGYTWGADAAADYFVDLIDCVCDSPLEIAAATQNLAGNYYNGAGLMKMSDKVTVTNLRDEDGSIATYTIG